MSTIRKLVELLPLSLFFASLAFAQGGAAGAIGGVVQDASGAVIANAKVSGKSEALGEVLRQVMTHMTAVSMTSVVKEIAEVQSQVNKSPGGTSR
jgi:hypothetical protein